MTRKQTITMDDVAKLANVSKPTVSRALSDSPLVKPETKKHVLSIARKYGYAINRNAQKLRHKRTNTIAVSLDYQSHRINHISDPFIFELLAGVSEALGERNQDLLLCAPTHNSLEAFQEILSSSGADGFIVLGQGHRELMLNEVAKTGAPIVVWGARTEDTPYCVVGSDNLLGGQLVGRYFLQSNRKRFLFVGDTTFKEMYWRRMGLQEAIRESERTITLDDIVLSNFSFTAAFNSAAAFLESVPQPPDAVFAYSDTAAMAFIRAFQAKGLRIPGEVSVVGYNDIQSASYFSPGLTTIRQDTYHAGRLLASSLMQILDGVPTNSEMIGTELIIRET